MKKIHRADSAPRASAARGNLTMPLLTCLLALLVAPGAVRASPGEDGGDLVLRHGHFYTVADDRSDPAEGSLVVEDGRIAFLGPDAEATARAPEGARIVDLGGRTVTPGLIDAHSHLAGLGAALAQVDLVGTGSYAEVVELVREAAAEAPEGTWIRGRGWDQNDWAETAFPTHHALSEAVPDHPVWLTRIDGHAALVNRRAMELLEIGPGTEDPPGGRFLRDAEGRPAGVLIDRAMEAVAGRIPDPGPEERRRRLRRAAEHAVALGLTTVTDMGVDQATIDDYRALRDAGELPLRAALFLTDDDPLLERWFARGPEVGPEHRVLVRGVKMYADGALGSRGAALVEPYSDDP
ncbi:MAG: amidohydrolase, partial [Thermoanaerobaculia bacterium]